MITAILVNYHCHTLTLRAVNSILKTQPGAQVIVVDNSVDEDECCLLQKTLPASVKILINKENIGFGRACNLAFKHAVHDWILLLNPDAYILEGCIDSLVTFLLQTPQAGAVSPLAFWDSAETWVLAPSQLPTPYTELAMAVGLRWRWFGRLLSSAFHRRTLRYILSKNAVKQKTLSGGHMLLRKSAIVASGGLFNPDFFMYYEDTDLCQRLQKNGYELYLLPSARAMHEWCATQGKNPLSEVSRHHYFSIHFSRSHLLALTEKFVQFFPRIALPVSQDLGLCQESPKFTIPADMQKSWVMELSPQPLLIPAFYLHGCGKECYIENELWKRLGAGDYWVRFSAANSKRVQRYHWRIE